MSYMNSITTIILAIIALALCYIIYKLHKIEKAATDLYELPHGESLYSISHHEFNSVSLQYILIAVRAIMHSWMMQSVATENYEAAESWKQTICEIEKLIKTKVNK